MAKQWHQLERLDHKALKKLQLEREKAAKLAAQQELRQKSIIIGGVIVFVFVLLIVLVITIKNKKDAEKKEQAREKLLYTNITEFLGTVEYRRKSDWSPLTKNLNFKEDYSFRTQEESSLSMQMQYDNTLKVYSSSEVTVNPPVLEKNEPKINKQEIELTRGELTAIISIGGRGLVHIKTSNVYIVAQSGLFKVIYNDEEDKGEVVVKNGLVEVSEVGSSEKPVKLSGFYKVTFEKGELSSPSQASVIQYDWH